MVEIAFTVYGLPGPQGSKSPKGRDRYGRVILVESSKKVKPWRAEVAKAARLAAERAGLAEVFDGPLRADMVFSLPRPKYHFRTGQFAGLLKDRYVDALPWMPPDLSKLVRSTEDALKHIIWADDGRVIGYGRLEKFYVDYADPDALTEPGAVIRVRPITTSTLKEVAP